MAGFYIGQTHYNSTVDNFNYNYVENMLDGATIAYSSALSGMDKNVSSSGDNFEFYDVVFTSKNDFSVNNSYYIRFKVKRRTDSNQHIYVKLYNDTVTDNQTQLIKEFDVAQLAVTNTTQDVSDYVVCDFIFKPLTNGFKKIAFILQRTSYDLQSYETGIVGRKIDIFIEELDKINDAPLSSGTCKKIGVQSKPGLIMCINGEEVRVGRTGIYEFNNDLISIDKFAIIEPYHDARDDDGKLVNPFKTAAAGGSSEAPPQPLASQILSAIQGDLKEDVNINTITDTITNTINNYNNSMANTTVNHVIGIQSANNRNRFTTECWIDYMYLG